MRPLDALVLTAYLAGVTAWGAWLGRGQRGARDYFLGGRDLPWPAVLLSIVATETSTLTFLSIPGVAYAGTLAFLQLAFGYIVGRTVVAAWLLPRYERGAGTTAYQLLEERFGRATRRTASAIFMGTRLLADGVRLFATALPLALLTGWPIGASIAVVGAATVVYTLVGGIRAVVWVDVLQSGLYLLGAAVAVVALHALVPGGWPAILERAAAAGKLRVVDVSFSLREPYTLWAGLVGGAFLSLASHGVDQLIVQRVRTTRDLAGARRAMIGSGFGVLFQFALFLLVGIGLWAHYGGRELARPDAAFATFIVEALPAGLTGLLVAGVLAAAMSTLSSSINALASASVYDFLAPALKADEDDPRLLAAARGMSGLWSALLIAAAVAFVPLSRSTAAVEVALAVASLVYGGLLGAYALASLVPRARQRDAIPAMLLGVATTSAVWALGGGAVGWPWFVPLGTLVTLGAGVALARRSAPVAGGTAAP